jgi:hypothetical protein
MRSPLRNLAAVATVLALLTWVASPALAGADDARLEGLLLGVDGRPATEMRVHLIDDQGRDLAQVATSEDGLYSFKDLPAGEYSLGIENAEGQMAPVTAPPVRVGQGELARRDLKLMEADPAAVNAATGANYGLGTWWASLTTAAKAWTAVAVLAVVGITWAALDEDDASPGSQPPAEE